ncbi:FUSC family protein [Streptacidiphilus sp. P02-A3a]|uniref:FUSC family protein n=1 Tax=Streptacidiphilus sp. P02-A3a TaxID=2704468 RepID=UPI0015FD15F5|nr:FUSC family protein [Streptacidiphilus sp. P02-A3a]QMU67153.1 FUSC family protein [Streptacidiphilus sp. P02-A3a]
MTDASAPRPAAAARVPPAIAWSWAAAGRGALFALPAALVAPHDPGQGLSLAIGVLPAALIGLPPTRRARLGIPVGGLCVGLPMVLGSLLSHQDLLAVFGVFAFAVAAARLAARRRFGMIAMSLCLPMVGAGLSYRDVGQAAGFALLILCGSLYAYLLTLLWPERPGPAGADPPVLMDRRTALDYGLRLGGCGASAAACGLALAPTHPGWPVTAALLVMRPAADMQRLRSVGRVVSVVVGGAAALLLLRADPPGWGYALTCLGAITLATATHGSHWYLTPAFTSLLVLLMLLHAEPAQAHGRFNERVTATLVGVALAYLFGLLLPRITGPGILKRQGAEGRSRPRVE